MSNDNFDYEDMIESGDYTEPVHPLNNEGSVNTPQQQQDIAPVNLSKGKVCVIVVVFLVFVLLILIVISGIDIKKNPNGNQGNSTQTSEVQNSGNTNTSNTSEKVADTSVENLENSPISSEPSSSSSDLNNNVNNGGDTTEGVLIQGEVVEQKPEEIVSKAEFELLDVEPMLGAEIEVSGMVKGISMYKVGSSYTYGVNLILIVGNDTNLECTYFCPKKTADALSIGTSLVVNYKADSNGNICVVSISR